jgi:hypothetical protein
MLSLAICELSPNEQGKNGSVEKFISRNKSTVNVSTKDCQ